MALTWCCASAADWGYNTRAEQARVRDGHVPRVQLVNLWQIPALLQAGDACYARVKYAVPFPGNLAKTD